MDGERKNARKRKGKKDAGETDAVAADPGKEETGDAQEPAQQGDLKVNGQQVPEEVLSPVSPGVDGSLDPIAKKVRNLNKKLKAIEELKEKAKRGERLEATQLKKMEGEVDIRKELGALGVTTS